MLEKIAGIVVSVISGYYDIKTDKGIIRSRARGIFRNLKQKPLVGDRVVVQPDDKGINYLVAVADRTCELQRPALANAEYVLLVMSATQPDFSVDLLDRYLVFFAWKKVKVVIFLSKTDLISSDELLKIKSKLNEYQKIGYQYFVDYQDLEQYLQNNIDSDEIWVLAGQSGVGKSTLLNRLKKDISQKTAEISFALNRGKHTTRQISLFEYGKGYTADTPGFSSIDLSNIKLDELKDLFYEIKHFSKECKFRQCQHINEPKCAVKVALNNHDILDSRYNSYIKIREEIALGRIPEYRK